MYKNEHSHLISNTKKQNANIQRMPILTEQNKYRLQSVILKPKYDKTVSSLVIQV